MSLTRRDFARTSAVAGAGVAPVGSVGALASAPNARNELNIGTEQEPESSEFTGVTFSPDGKTLYANIQEPGVMLAVTGPWKRQKRG